MDPKDLKARLARDLKEVRRIDKQIERRRGRLVALELEVDALRAARAEIAQRWPEAAPAEVANA